MDEQLRALERRWQASGDDEDLARYVSERLRVDADLTLRLIKRVIALERNVPNTMNLPVTDKELLDFLDNDRELPTVHVPSVFSGEPGPTGLHGTLSVSDGVPGVESLPTDTITEPMDEFRVRQLAQEEIEYRVSLHAHFHCMKPGCNEQMAEVMSSASQIQWHTPVGWQRHCEMLLCSMHCYQAAQICDHELGGHVHPEYPPSNSTYSCTRCGYGPIYPAMLD
jgi:hypothetical protein